MPQVRIVDERDMDAPTDAAIRRGLCICFPNDAAVFGRTRAWHGSAPAYSVLMEQGGGVIAHAGVVDRTIDAGAERLRVGGVQNVFVLPEFRGGGLVEQVMAAAMDEASKRGMEAGLLFCLLALEKVYARMGWRTLSPRPVWARRSDGTHYRLDEKNILMFHPLARDRFPDGAIELNGEDW